MPQQYTRWYPNDFGGQSLQFWDKLALQWRFVGDYDFHTGAMWVLYGTDPNYAEIYSSNIVIDNGGVGGKPTEKENPFPGLGFIGSITDTPKKKTWLIVAAVAVAGVAGYFIYKNFK